MDPWKRRFQFSKPSFPGSMLNLGGVSSNDLLPIIVGLEPYGVGHCSPANSCPKKNSREAFCGLRDAMDGKGFSKLWKAGSFFYVFFGRTWWEKRQALVKVWSFSIGDICSKMVFNGKFHTTHQFSFKKKVPTWYEWLFLRSNLTGTLKQKPLGPKRFADFWHRKCRQDCGLLDRRQGCPVTTVTMGKVSDFNGITILIAISWIKVFINKSQHSNSMMQWCNSGFPGSCYVSSNQSQWLCSSRSHESAFPCLWWSFACFEAFTGVYCSRFLFNLPPNCLWVKIINQPRYHF